MALSESETPKPHVAVLPSPGIGHTIPLVEFSKRLVVDHGFHVSFLNITSDSSPAKSQLLHSPNLPSSLHVIDLPPADATQDDTTVGTHHQILTRLCLIVQENLKPLKSVLLCLHPKPKALVVDLFCTQAFDVCQELSIPVYSFYTASPLLLAFSLYLPTLDSEVIDCEFVDLPEPVRVPGCSQVRTEDLLDQVRNRNTDDYRWLLFHLSRLPLAFGIFLNAWEDLDSITLRALRENPFYQQIAKTPPVYAIGPIIKEAESDLSAECLTWLDKQPQNSVVYVSFGSGGTVTAKQLTELAWGLEMSEQRFIWVIKAPSDSTSSGTFFSAGSEANNDDDKTASFLPEGFLERTKDVGRVVPSWAPQVAVLSHQSTGAYWSHCGWNSILESVAHGVPMIAWPLYAEQKMNATVLAEDVRVAVKPGVVVEDGKGIVMRQEIARVVRMVIEGEEGEVLRRRAKELKESAARALSSDGGSSYEALTSAVKQWKV